MKIFKASILMALIAVVQTRPSATRTNLFNMHSSYVETEPRKMLEYCTRSCKHEHFRRSRNLEDYNDCLNDCIMLNVGHEILQKWLSSFAKP